MVEELDRIIDKIISLENKEKRSSKRFLLLEQLRFGVKLVKNSYKRSGSNPYVNDILTLLQCQAGKLDDGLKCDIDLFTAKVRGEL